MKKKLSKWLTLRKKINITWALLAVGCVLAVSVIFFIDAGPQLLASSSLCFVLAVVLDLLWWRCPYCGCYLGRGQRDGEYCRKCGKRVFWDNHDDFQDLEEQ